MKYKHDGKSFAVLGFTKRSLVRDFSRQWSFHHLTPWFNKPKPFFFTLMQQFISHSFPQRCNGISSWEHKSSKYLLLRTMRWDELVCRRLGWWTYAKLQFPAPLCLSSTLALRCPPSSRRWISLTWWPLCATPMTGAPTRKSAQLFRASSNTMKWDRPDTLLFFFFFYHVCLVRRNWCTVVSLSLNSVYTMFSCHSWKTSDTSRFLLWKTTKSSRLQVPSPAALWLHQFCFYQGDGQCYNS